MKLARRTPGTTRSLMALTLSLALAGTASAVSAPAASAATTYAYGWGQNSSGEATAVASTNPVTAPAAVSGIGYLKTVVALKDVSFGLRSDGKVVSWGFFSDSRLGRTTTAPKLVPGWTGVTAITHSHGKVLAQTSEGKTLCAGPDCTASDFSVSDYDPAMGQVFEMAFSLGDYVLYRRTSGGSVWATGERRYVAPGTTGNSYDRVTAKIPSFKNIVSISAGYSRMTALDSSGRVWAIGWTPGDGTAQTARTAVLVPGLTNVKQVDMPDISGDSRYALKSDGTVWEWGAAYDDGAPGTKPRKVTSLPPTKSLVVKRGTGYALTTSGEVWQWDAGNPPVPSKVSGIAGATKLSAFGDDGWSSDLAAYAFLSNGTVLSWGSGASGQLGTGTTTDRSTPAAVKGLTNVRALDGSGSTTLALRSTTSS